MSTSYSRGRMSWRGQWEAGEGDLRPVFNGYMTMLSCLRLVALVSSKGANAVCLSTTKVEITATLSLLFPDIRDAPFAFLIGSSATGSGYLYLGYA